MKALHPLRTNWPDKPLGTPLEVAAPEVPPLKLALAKLQGYVDSVEHKASVARLEGYMAQRDARQAEIRETFAPLAEELRALVDAGLVFDDAPMTPEEMMAEVLGIDPSQVKFE